MIITSKALYSIKIKNGKSMNGFQKQYILDNSIKEEELTKETNESRHNHKKAQCFGQLHTYVEVKNQIHNLEKMFFSQNKNA